MTKKVAANRFLILTSLENFPKTFTTATFDCRREGIAESLYYSWSKEFLEAGKRRLSGDTARQATSPEVKELRSESLALKECVADLTLENRLLKKSMTGDGGYEE